jgi:DNA-binding NarL/FixJ family response regulator
MKKVKLLLADSEPVFREGLAKILLKHQTIEVVSECASGLEAVNHARDSKADMIVLDDLSSDNTPDIIKQLRQTVPDLIIAVIGHPEKTPNVADIIRAGGKACLSKTSTADDLLKSLELISRGRVVISPVFVESFVSQIADIEKGNGVRKADKAALISDRELEIVRLVVEGATNKEIARELGISENTAKVHVKNILGKLLLKNRQQLVTRAFKETWVSIKQPADPLDESSGD